jgi:tRNA modification GTPase
MLTPPGPAAIAVIALWGEGLAEFLPRLWPHGTARQIPVGEFRLVRWQGCGDGALNSVPAEEVLLCRPDETAVEIHCHGGAIASRRIADDLARAGAVASTPDAWLARKLPWYVVRCRLALSRGTTTRMCELVMEQQRKWARLLEALQGDTPLATFSSLADRVRNGVGWSREPDRSGRPRSVRFSSLLEPVPVVLFGPPNAGKSSLLNRLAGYTRSIVHHEAGTTRDVVTCATAFGGWPTVLADTAGLRATSDAIEQAGVDRAQASVAAAGLRLLVIDSAEWPVDTDWQRWNALQPDLVLANKSDLQPIGPRGPAAPVLPVSARTGEGIEALTGWLDQQLSERVPPGDLAVPLDAEMENWMGLLHEALVNHDGAAIRLVAGQALAVGG